MAVIQFAHQITSYNSDPPLKGGEYKLVDHITATDSYRATRVMSH